MARTKVNPAPEVLANPMPETKLVRITTDRGPWDATGPMEQGREYWIPTEDANVLIDRGWAEEVKVEKSAS